MDLASCHPSGTSLIFGNVVHRYVNARVYLHFMKSLNVTFVTPFNVFYFTPILISDSWSRETKPLP